MVQLSPIKRDPDMTLNKEEDVEDIPISVPIFDEDQQQDVDKNQISIQSINDSFSRDVRYSLEVWVPADGLQNLNMSDKQILESKGWLNDLIMPNYSYTSNFYISPVSSKFSINLFRSS